MSALGDRDGFVAHLLAWLNLRLAPPGVTITADTPLFAGGMINSMRILEVIAWVERAAGRTIADREIRMDNFATVTRIAQVFVKERDDVAA